MTPDWRTARDRALFQLEHEKDPGVRAEAAEQLCDLASGLPADLRLELAPAIVRMVADAQSEVRCGGVALAALVLPGDEAAELITRHLKDKDLRMRIEATGRLADLARSDSRGAFAATLTDDVLAVRFEAARGMAALKHSAGLDVLVEALNDVELRFRAISALAELGDPAALPALKKQFGKWLMPAFDRTQLAGAIVKLGDPSAAAHLFKRSEKKWTVDRAMAIELLGEVKAPGARARLEQIVADKADSARGAAARGLGRLGDPAAAPALVAVMHEEGADDDLKLDAAEGLWLLPARDLVKDVKLSSPEAQAELSAMMAPDP